ncbi:hypothetical protein T439DRAFT_383181 [Meredithblackwellia eburnea MCA 4105]
MPSRALELITFLERSTLNAQQLSKTQKLTIDATILQINQLLNDPNYPSSSNEPNLKQKLKQVQKRIESLSIATITGTSSPQTLAPPNGHASPSPSPSTLSEGDEQGEAEDDDIDEDDWDWEMELDLSDPVYQTAIPPTPSLTIPAPTLQDDQTLLSESRDIPSPLPLSTNSASNSSLPPPPKSSTTSLLPGPPPPASSSSSPSSSSAPSSTLTPGGGVRNRALRRSMRPSTSSSVSSWPPPPKENVDPTLPTSALLEHHAALQTSLVSSLTSMSTQLKTNSQMFSESLEKDKEVMEKAKEKLEGNLEGMKKEGGRLNVATKKGRGMVWITVGVVGAVAAMWVAMFLMIKVT